MMRDLFYKILNSGLWGDGGRVKGLAVSENETDILFRMGLLQAVGGLMMMGMNECGIVPVRNKSQWISTLIHIEQKNRKIEVLAERIVSELKTEGAEAEIFKGVSVAKWYRNPQARSYGDIDVVITEGFGKIVNILEKKGIGFKSEH